MNKVLIVDDSATMRKIITRVLRQAEIPCATVLEAGNGVEGMAKLQSDPDIDLILSDINMPEMNGVDFVKAVRATRSKETLPMIIPAMIMPMRVVSPTLWSNSSREISAAQAPPIPLKRETSSGIAVILTRLAVIQPMTVPRSSPPNMRKSFIESRLVPS